jgi:signal transduction histidine kinase
LVEDDGAGFDTDKKDKSTVHIGIDNVRQRLKGMCRATLEVKSMVNVGTRVTVPIPKNKKGMI